MKPKIFLDTKFIDISILSKSGNIVIIILWLMWSVNRYAYHNEMRVLIDV